MTNERVFFLFFIPLTHVVPWSLYQTKEILSFFGRAMVVNIMQCHVCHQTFTCGSTLKDHIKRIHQRSASITFPNGSIVNVEREEDGEFLCLCNRRFTVPSTLRRHA